MADVNLLARSKGLSASSFMRMAIVDAVKLAALQMQCQSMMGVNVTRLLYFRCLCDVTTGFFIETVTV